MAEDITNLRLSKQATYIANKLKDDGIFEDALTAAKFGFAFAIKYYPDEIPAAADMENYEKIYDSTGSNYNVGSVDPDKYIANVIQLLYPGCASPYKYARIIMCFGLNKLSDFDEAGNLLPIYKKM